MGSMEVQKDPKSVKLMRILDPAMCLRCESAYFADVRFPDGRTKKMFYCSRLDCDNWDTSGVPEEEEITADEEGAY